MRRRRPTPLLLRGHRLLRPSPGRATNPPNTSIEMAGQSLPERSLASAKRGSPTPRPVGLDVFKELNMDTIRPAPHHIATRDHAADGLDGQRHAGFSHRGDVARASASVSAELAAGSGHDDGRSDAASIASGHADLDRLLPVFHRLVDDTVTQVLACPAKPDPAFEGFEELLAPIRSATTLEGNLLERGIKAICACRSDLIVVPLETPLPVLWEARAFLKRNDWSKASALRLGSEVHTREFYRPDLLVVDASQHRALILDIKRSVLSHKPKVLLELRTRMMAAALVARDWLERECDAPAIERVEIAIVDGSGEPADHAKAIFSLADLDRLLGIEGAYEAIIMLRRLYGARIREIMLDRCKAVVRSMTPGSVGKAAQLNEIDHAGPRLDLGDVNGSEDAWAEDEGSLSGSAGMPRTVSSFVRDRHVSVSIASVGGRA